MHGPVVVVPSPPVISEAVLDELVGDTACPRTADYVLGQVEPFFAGLEAMGED